MSTATSIDRPVVDDGAFQVTDNFQPSVNPIISAIEHFLATVLPNHWEGTDPTGKLCPMTLKVVPHSASNPLRIHLNWTSDKDHDLKCDLALNGHCTITYDNAVQKNGKVRAGIAHVGLKPEVILKFDWTQNDNKPAEVRCVGWHK